MAEAIIGFTMTTKPHLSSPSLLTTRIETNPFSKSCRIGSSSRLNSNGWNQQNSHRNRSTPVARLAEENPTGRRKIISTILTTSLALGGIQVTTPIAIAEAWGTRSFIKERFFEPGLSPEDAVARIRQTAEGLHSMREMLDTMSWRYVIFYIRLKQAYLSQDLKNALTTLPEGRRKPYVEKANELVDNMAEFDHYVRTPKVYESYIYYEKTLKSLDDLVALLA